MTKYSRWCRVRSWSKFFCVHLNYLENCWEINKNTVSKYTNFLYDCDDWSSSSGRNPVDGYMNKKKTHPHYGKTNTYCQFHSESKITICKSYTDYCNRKSSFPRGFFSLNSSITTSEAVLSPL